MSEVLAPEGRPTGGGAPARRGAPGGTSVPVLPGKEGAFPGLSAAPFWDGPCPWCGDLESVDTALCGCIWCEVCGGTYNFCGWCFPLRGGNPGELDRSVPGRKL